IVEERDDDTLLRRLFAPEKRSGDVVDPPLVAVAVTAIVSGLIVDGFRGDERGTGLGPARELAPFRCGLGRRGLGAEGRWHECSTAYEKSHGAKGASEGAGHAPFYEVVRRHVRAASQVAGSCPDVRAVPWPA